eukprot:3241162-Rhodomonas_salina.1
MASHVSEGGGGTRAGAGIESSATSRRGRHAPLVRQHLRPASSQHNTPTHQEPLTDMIWYWHGYSQHACTRQ